MRWRRKKPLLSVVVPVYNVAEYLPTSLTSILEQPVRDLEVLVVDDGSTDASLALAQEFAGEDPRVTVLTQENSGVSIARNRAVAECRAPYLTFVDPDDELPADAWSTMLATLQRTGSDFVVGKAERVKGNRRFVTPLMERNHRVERLGATIDDLPLMLADVFVWNKIFRRDFWTGARIWFPERTRYQDQPALTQAFLAARSFDVLTEVVYEWQVRPRGDSATQKRREVKNLQERIATKRMTVEMVRAHGSTVIADVLHAEILPIDMWEHFRAARHEGDEYWELLRDATREFWNETTVPFHCTAVPVQQRLMGWFVTQDRRRDLLALLDFLDAHRPVPVEQHGDRFVLAHPWWDDPTLPESLTVVGPEAGTGTAVPQGRPGGRPS